MFQKFLSIQKKYNFSIIEFTTDLVISINLKKFKKNSIIFIFSQWSSFMDGSKTVEDRKDYLNLATRLFLIVTGPKKVLEGLENKFVNSHKLVVFFQSASKKNISILKKKRTGSHLLEN